MKNWKQCVYKDLNDDRDTGMIKVWILPFPKTKIYKSVEKQNQKEE